jgi:hypothetical protein
MNIEELKLVLETIATLGAQGKEAFIWWVVLDKIPFFVLWAAFIGLLFFITKSVKKYNSDEQFLTSLRDILGYGDGYLSTSERIRTKNKVLQLVEAYVAENGKPYK